MRRILCGLVLAAAGLVWQTDGCIMIVDQYGRNCWWCCFGGMCTLDCL